MSGHHQKDHLIYVVRISEAFAVLARASHSAASKSPFCPERAAGKFRAKANERQSLIADNWLQSATGRRRGKFANRPSSTHSWIARSTRCGRGFSSTDNSRSRDLLAEPDGDLVIECPLDVVSRIIGRISPIVYTGDHPVNGGHSCRSNVSDSPPSSDTRH